MTQKSGYSGLLVICLAFAAYVLVQNKPAHIGDSEEDDLRAPAASSIAADAGLPSEKIAEPILNKQPQKEDSADRKIKILDEIFLAKNDNDPRLDTEFNNLSQADRAQLERKYSEQPKEKLNERGTLVFLLGRNISTLQDLSFLRSVASEAPCQDFNNCSRLSEGERDDHAGLDELTLAYPQVVALKAVDNFLNSSSQDIQMRRLAEEIVANALKSKNGVVSNLAQDISNSSRL